MPARNRTAWIATLATSTLLIATAVAHANVALTQIITDPFTNSTSQHKTEVEPDTFAFGSTIVAAFQVGRFTDGGGSDIGWATSTNSGATWTQGTLPGITTQTAAAPTSGSATPASPTTPSTTSG